MRPPMRPLPSTILTLLLRSSAVLALAVMLLRPATASSQETRVRIVDYDRKGDSAPARWVVGASPDLVIGAAHGSEEELLTNPLAAVRLSDGTIAIRDSSGRFFWIKYYDSAGRHLVTASRFGDGPFEFQIPVGVHPWPGDSILVVGEDRSFALFGPRGEPGRAGRIEASNVIPLTPLGSYLVDPLHLAFRKPVGPRGLPPPGVHRGRSGYLVWTWGDTVASTVWEPEEQPGYFERMPDREGVFFYPYPFAPQTAAAAGGGRLWIGVADVPRIRGYDGDGRLRVMIRFTDEAVKVQRTDRRRFRRAVLDRTSGWPSEKRFARYARYIEYPDAMPRFGGFEVDRLGKLWVERYAPPWAEGAWVWDVFDVAGRWIATAALPESLIPGCARDALMSYCDKILEIGSDYILMDVTDLLGVRRVMSFPLERSR
jgi:hypothetical protein